MTERVQQGGALYVVATPIGNLDDLGSRAARVLREVDVVLAEDTRHTAHLLAHAGAHTKMAALHEHNEAQVVERWVERVAAGARVALVSDAGTPLVSDPGYRLVRAMQARGLPVRAVPGACAAVCALSVAGLPTDRFAFEGFLPPRAAARRARLAAVAGDPRTLVFYESPRRVTAMVADLVSVLGAERPAAVARELTKIHEEVVPGTLAMLAAWLSDRPDRIRGEFVVLVAGAAEEPAPAVDADRVLPVLLDALPASQAVALAARITGRPRNDLYRQAVALRGE